MDTSSKNIKHKPRDSFSSQFMRKKKQEKNCAKLESTTNSAGSTGSKNVWMLKTKKHIIRIQATNLAHPYWTYITSILVNPMNLQSLTNLNSKSRFEKGAIPAFGATTEVRWSGLKKWTQNLHIDDVAKGQQTAAVVFSSFRFYTTSSFIYIYSSFTLCSVGGVG